MQKTLLGAKPMRGPGWDFRTVLFCLAVFYASFAAFDAVAGGRKAKPAIPAACVPGARINSFSWEPETNGGTLTFGYELTCSNGSNGKPCKFLTSLELYRWNGESYDLVNGGCSYPSLGCDSTKNGSYSLENVITNDEPGSYMVIFSIYTGGTCTNPTLPEIAVDYDYFSFN